MQPIQLWNVIKNANEPVLWTPMWNWNVFSNETLKENYLGQIKVSISPIISNLDIGDFSAQKRTEELEATSVLFLLYCAIVGVKDNLEDYFSLLGRRIPPRPQAKWEDGAPVSVEDPHETDRQLPARLLSLAGEVLERFPVGDHGNQARCRIIWEAPVIMDDRSKKIFLSVWRHIGFAESHLDIWGNRECNGWNTQGDNFAFFLRCVHLLNDARLSHERNGKVLPQDVSPQIRSIVDDLNKEKAWFKQVSVSRFLDMNDGCIKLYSKCCNYDGSSVWAKRDYGDEFEISVADRYDFALKFYVDQKGRGRQKIVGRLPKDVWFFESTENENVFKMVPKKVGYLKYSYPIVVAVAVTESNKNLIQSSKDYFVGRLKLDDSKTGERYFYRFETSKDFGKSLIRLFPTVPVLLRPKRNIVVEYCAPGTESWLPVDDVCIDWPHVPQAHCFAAIQWRKNEVFENADMLEDFRSFAVKDFRLNMDGANLQGIKIALLPSGFTIREQYDNQSMLSGVKFYKYGDVELGRNELEMSSIEGDRGFALFNTIDGGLMKISFDVRLAPPVNKMQATECADNRLVVRNVVSKDEIRILRSGSSLESIEKLLMLGLNPEDDHIIRAVRNGVSLQDLSDRSIRLSRDVKQKLLYSSYNNFVWIINHGYHCTDDNIIVAITAYESAIDNFVYKGASVSQKVLKAALEKRKTLWNDIAQWDYEIPEVLKREFFERTGFLDNLGPMCLKLQKMLVKYDWKNIYKIKNPERETLELAINRCNNPEHRHKLGAILDAMPDESLGKPENIEFVLNLQNAVSLPYYGQGLIQPGIVGSKVRHKKMPDLGIGEVIEVSKPKYLKIKFENGKVMDMTWDAFCADPKLFVEFI